MQAENVELQTEDVVEVLILMTDADDITSAKNFATKTITIGLDRNPPRLVAVVKSRLSGLSVSSAVGGNESQFLAGKNR